MSVEALSAIATRELVNNAVGPTRGVGLRALQDRLFAYLFRGLVYAQIWEDPEVDLAALELEAHHHVVTIASGGCNALSYLTAAPAKITAVDLNRAHVALLQLKIAGVKYFPDWDRLYQFFGAADDKANPALYRRYIARHLDIASSTYWEGRSAFGRRRISGFARNVYKRGLLGKFIGAGHGLARLNGLRLADILECRDVAEQRAYFESNIRPLFSKRLVRWITKSPVALFGLGIPPAQFDALADDKDMRSVLEARLERLACGHALKDNYFAWQAFGRSYAPDASGSLPPYLQRVNYAKLKANVGGLTVRQANLTTILEEAAPGSVDRVVLLDAQDWMNDSQLNALWLAITRTATPGARVIFRTAGEAMILPGRVETDVLGKWNYLETLSRDLHMKDRSAIYGGFHVYEFRA
jgi:S-adenosylmethionine-diacylglycerol 3-amino-3-carboxypropyl transferase